MCMCTSLSLASLLSLCSFPLPETFFGPSASSVPFSFDNTEAIATTTLLLPRCSLSTVNHQSHLLISASLNNRRDLLPNPPLQKGCLSASQLTKWNLRASSAPTHQKLSRMSSYHLATEGRERET
ncbi:hypothetical protein EUGRSUZ_A01267 [Eucalyptus grandis]|uniref:Uncharacterized protein n=2 Tax=Eucalyptus grandis TaxID=71139 RepID=A0ACC3M2P5_EUCGR|nr:hypothetical protein EUGRSUZ_A01267 [Eucalyptus grandis]